MLCSLCLDLIPLMSLRSNVSDFRGDNTCSACTFSFVTFLKTYWPQTRIAKTALHNPLKCARIPSSHSHSIHVPHIDDSHNNDASHRYSVIESSVCANRKIPLHNELHCTTINNRIAAYLQHLEQCGRATRTVFGDGGRRNGRNSRCPQCTKNTNNKTYQTHVHMHTHIHTHSGVFSACGCPVPVSQTNSAELCVYGASCVRARV